MSQNPAPWQAPVNPLAELKTEVAGRLRTPKTQKWRGLPKLLGYIGIIMENRMENHMEHEMEIGII